jgi:hypothetical protein
MAPTEWRMSFGRSPPSDCASLAGSAQERRSRSGLRGSRPAPCRRRPMEARPRLGGFLVRGTESRANSLQPTKASSCRSTGICQGPFDPSKVVCHLPHPCVKGSVVAKSVTPRPQATIQERIAKGLQEGVQRHRNAVGSLVEELSKPQSQSPQSWSSKPPSQSAAVNGYVSLANGGNFQGKVDAVSSSSNPLAIKTVTLSSSNASIEDRLADDVVQGSKLVGLPVHRRETFSAVDIMKNFAGRGKGLYGEDPAVEANTPNGTQVGVAYAKSLSVVRVGPTSAVEVGAEAGVVAASNTFGFQKNVGGWAGSVESNNKIGVEGRFGFRAGVESAGRAEVSAGVWGFAGAKAAASGRLARRDGFLEVRVDALAGIGGFASAHAGIGAGAVSFDVNFGAAVPFGASVGVAGEINYQRHIAWVFQLGQKSRRAFDRLGRPGSATS